MQHRRVLVLAESCNPEWPSLPIVGYKYAKAMANYADITLVTHVRNRPAIEAAKDMPVPIHYIDTEWLAAPLYRLSKVLRGNDQVAWSTSTIMKYPSYLAFEFQAWHHFRMKVQASQFDLIHRITPMSPTIPSPIAKRAGIPFIIGPLNGNLDWPADFREEQHREKERARALRAFYKIAPYARSTQNASACILAAFEHTKRDLNLADNKSIVSFPEIGYDPEIFFSDGRRTPFSRRGNYEFLFVGRLVPYKLAEAAIKAFATSTTLRQHKLTVIGDGPEYPRLYQLVQDLEADEIISLEGKKTQREVAEAMRKADAFVFPSIRELGAGVVIEAMACGALNIVVDYGAPGALVANGRGVAIPIAPLAEIVNSLQSAMEHCIQQPDHHASLAVAGHDYAESLYTWDAKAQHTASIYEAVLQGRPLSEFTAYE